MRRDALCKLSLVGTAMLALSQVGKVSATSGVQTLSQTYSDCYQYARLTDCTDCYQVGTTQQNAITRFPYSSSTSQVFGTAQDYEQVQCSFVGECPDGVQRNTCSWQRYQTFTCVKDLLNLGSYIATTSTNYPAQAMSYFNTLFLNNANFQLAASQQLNLFITMTNSLPNHCYYVDHNAPSGSTSAFQAYGLIGVFNPTLLFNDIYLAQALGGEADLDYVYYRADDQQDLDNYLCDHTWAKASFLPATTLHVEFYGRLTLVPAAGGNPASTTLTSRSWEYSYQSSFAMLRLPDSSPIVGVALNGVFFFAGSSHYGYDAFFPKAYGTRKSPEAIEVDVCLGTADNYNTYRYHMFSPCIYDIALRDRAMDCANDAVCSKDVRNHSLAHIPEQLKTQDPIGIAKDGRIIYGPYRTDGLLWQPCDVDICNGVKFSRLNYGYVATMFHPYIVGCWGPGNRPVKRSQSCSTNGRWCASGSNLLTSIAVLALTISALFY